MTADHLGSPRIVTGSNGSVVSRHDYQPFGGELFAGMGSRTIAQGYSNPADSLRQKFTGKERDNETSLDYFGARYYSSTQGRFTSCDPIGISKRHIVNPQKWNLYTYVLNNPLALSDPNGKQEQGKGGGRVIDVFLVFDPADRTRDASTGKPGPGPNWKQIQDNAPKGVTINVYGPDKSTKEKIEESRKNSTATFIVGHGQQNLGDQPPVIGGLPTVNWDGFQHITTEIRDGSGTVMTDLGEPGAGNVTGLFTCNSAGYMPSRVSGDLIVNTGGNDGITAVGTLEDATAAAVVEVSNLSVPLDQAINNGVQKAQEVVNKQYNVPLGVPGGRLMNNDGDKIKRVKGTN